MITIIFLTNTTFFIIVTLLVISFIFIYRKHKKVKSDNNSSDNDMKSEMTGFSEFVIISLGLCLIVSLIFKGDSGIYWFIGIGLFLWLPFILTVANIKNLIKNIHKAIFTDISTIIIGGIYYFFLMGFDSVTDSDYKTAIYPNEYHEILNGEYGMIISWVILTGVISLVLLSVRSPSKIPPLQSVILISFDILMLLLVGIIQIQMFMNFDIHYLLYYLYYLNLIIISVRRIHYHITEQVKFNNEHEIVFRTRAGEKLHKLMSAFSGMTKLSFLFMFPIIAICEILYIILGQGVDGFIKAFTMTADWTFSTQTPPPPLEYSGHYLCTVAVCGHKEVVKPIRYGIRHNRKIIVNRQLLVANAFEDIIAERFPRFHKRIRKFYDTYGYPISKHITTKLRADVIYIFMKPLEYMFLIYLYMFDLHPEQRIAIQYSDYKHC